MKKEVFMCAECGSLDIELYDSGYICYECGFSAIKKESEYTISECPFCGCQDIIDYYEFDELVGVICIECDHIAYYDERL